MLTISTMWTWLLCAVYSFVLWQTHASVDEDVVGCEPRHVHVAFGGAPDQISVVWATNSSCDSEVAFGASPWKLGFKVEGTSHNFTKHNANGLHVLHKATLTGLQESTTYFYRPLSNKISSGPFFFQSPSAGMDWSPEILVAGELGPHLELLPLLSEVALSGQYNAVLQIGGLSSYLADGNGTKGDQLMQLIQPVAAFIPFMTAPGLSESPTAPYSQYDQYRERFSMPGSQWPMPADKLWYSFNLGPVHFVSYCTDIYFRDDKDLQQRQLRWLTQDLSEANHDRAKRPWIVAFGQHPLYCTACPQCDCASNTSLVRAGLEDTLYYYGVDLILQSHPHSYERLYPLFKGVVLSSNYTNPRAPVQIITGTASQTHVANTPPPPSVSPSPAKAETNSSTNSSSNSNSTVDVVGTDSGAGSRNHSNTDQNMTAFLMVNGSEPTYGRLHVINSTHAHWQLLSGMVGREGEILDMFWLIQEHHGKFQMEELPKEVTHQIDQNLVSEGGKPGVLNVEDPDQVNANSSENTLLAAVANHRLIIGVSAGVAVLLFILIIVVVKRCRRSSTRRVARRWDSMDYKYGKTRLYTPTNDDEDEDDDDFRDDFVENAPEQSLQTKKLINGK